MKRPISALLSACLISCPLALEPRRAEAMTCSFTSVVGVSFGNYNVYSSADVDGAGSFTFLCEQGLPSVVTIDISTGSSGSYATRTLKNGTSTLNYNVWSTAARTGDPWGDGTNSTTHYGPVLVVLGEQTTLNVYGRIPGAQANALAGAHSDTLILTITF